MTVDAYEFPVTFTVASGQADYAFTGEYWSKLDLWVELSTDGGTTWTAPVLDVDFRVEPEGLSYDGGKVIPLSGWPAGALLRVDRRTRDLQEFSAPAAGTGYERALDRLTMRQQELSASADRSLRLTSDAPVTPALDPEAVKGRLLASDPVTGAFVPGALRGDVDLAIERAQNGVIPVDLGIPKWPTLAAAQAALVIDAALPVPNYPVGATIDIAGLVSEGDGFGFRAAVAAAGAAGTHPLADRVRPLFNFFNRPWTSTADFYGDRTAILDQATQAAIATGTWAVALHGTDDDWELTSQVTDGRVFYRAMEPGQVVRAAAPMDSLFWQKPGQVGGGLYGLDIRGESLITNYTVRVEGRGYRVRHCTADDLAPRVMQYALFDIAATAEDALFEHVTGTRCDQLFRVSSASKDLSLFECGGEDYGEYGFRLNIVAGSRGPWVFDVPRLGPAWPSRTAAKQPFAVAQATAGETLPPGLVVTRPHFLLGGEVHDNEERDEEGNITYFGSVTRGSADAISLHHTFGSIVRHFYIEGSGELGAQASRSGGDQIWDGGIVKGADVGGISIGTSGSAIMTNIRVTNCTVIDGAPDAMDHIQQPLGNFWFGLQDGLVEHGNISHITGATEYHLIVHDCANSTMSGPRANGAGGYVRYLSSNDPLIPKTSFTTGAPQRVIRVRKLADEPRASTDTPALDSELQRALPAGTKWLYRMRINYLAGETVDLKRAFQLPGDGSGFGWNMLAAVPGNDTYDIQADFPLGGQGTNWPNGATGYIEHGSIDVGPTGGVCGLMWAQNNVNATAATVLEGSYIEFEELTS